jgi:prepilin-type N-terminal cleavage/methylation domain-containing protein
MPPAGFGGPKSNWTRTVFHNARGFTLIELLIAIGILTGGLMTMARLFAYSATVTATSQHRTLATLVLYEKLEQLKEIPLSDPAWAPGQHNEIYGPYSCVSHISGNVPRTATVVVLARLNRRAAPLELARATTMAAP